MDEHRHLLDDEDTDEVWPGIPESPNSATAESTATVTRSSSTLYSRIPCRYVLAVMMLIGFGNAFAQRIVFSIALVAMVNFTEANVINETSQECPVSPETANSTVVTYTGTFNWNANLQGFLLAAFFYGYPLTQLPGGYLAERFGSKLVFGFVGLSTGVCSLLLPVVAKWNVYAVIALRALQGLFQGPLYPSCIAMWSRWAPQNERAKLYAIANSGATLGSAIGLGIAGVMCQSNFLGGWPSPFYLFGSLSIIWYVFWMLIVHNTPATHPRISAKERAFIERETESLDTVKYVNPPWCEMIKSAPIWGVLIVLITDSLGFYVSFSSLPIYMKQVLRFDISQDGFMSALPYLAQMPTLFFVGFVADAIRKSGLMKAVNIRRTSVIIGDLMPAVFLMLAGYVGCNKVAAVSFFVIGLAANAFMTVGPSISIMDIAPMYSGTIVGALNGLANIGGIIAPIMVAAISGNSSNRHAWQNVFYITLATYTFGVIVYCLLITGEELHWSKQRRINNSTDQPSDNYVHSVSS